MHEPTVQAIIVNYRDVTERRQAEERSMQFLDVLEASLNEIYIFDPQTFRFEYVNEGARRNLGYPMEQLLATHGIGYKSRSFPKPPSEKWSNPYCFMKRINSSFKPPTAGQTAVCTRWRVHLQLVERGSRALFLAFINDITERKRAEEILLVKEAAIASSINCHCHVRPANGLVPTMSTGLS
ncbi:MAG: PAS domain-containing protein [Ignavibacteriales bacterium]|nr:PAS domain-containing protein [Ignavibacteriales bacterium]